MTNKCVTGQAGINLSFAINKGYMFMLFVILTKNSYQNKDISKISIMQNRRIIYERI